jgi:hypothetical protein
MSVSARMFTTKLSPQGRIEQTLVDQLVIGLWRIRRLDYAEYAFLQRLLKIQAMDRKFEIHESVMSINGKKVRSDAETEKLLVKEAKNLRPNNTDLNNGLRTLVESELELSSSVRSAHGCERGRHRRSS